MRSLVAPALAETSIRVVAVSICQVSAVFTMVFGCLAVLACILAMRMTQYSFSDKLFCWKGIIDSACAPHTQAASTNMLCGLPADDLLERIEEAKEKHRDDPSVTLYTENNVVRAPHARAHTRARTHIHKCTPPHIASATAKTRVLCLHLKARHRTRLSPSFYTTRFVLVPSTFTGRRDCGATTRIRKWCVWCSCKVRCIVTDRDVALFSRGLSRSCLYCTTAWLLPSILS